MAESDGFAPAVRAAVDGKGNTKARRVLGARLVGNKRHLMLAMSRSDRSFETLYDFIFYKRPKGVGPKTAYEVAVRLGTFFDVAPNERTEAHVKATCKDRV